MSRDNLCIGLERDHEYLHPKTCKIFRKIIENSDNLLNQEECMNLYDIFCGFLNDAGNEKYEFTTKTYLV